MKYFHRWQLLKDTKKINFINFNSKKPVYNGCACMERAAKNSSSEDMILKFSPKFYKNIMAYKTDIDR